MEPVLSTDFAVLTNRYDNARTGVNAGETQLTQSNVNVAHFGQLFSRTVEGQIYADPLYVGGLSIAGAPHNVVYVATEHDKVYAFDADRPSLSSPLWTKDIGPSGSMSLIGCQDITDQIGVTSTPVIDPATGTLYVVAKVHTASAWLYQLRALDVTTGADQHPAVTITATVPGTGVESVNGEITFDPFTHHNRDGLLLAGSTLYIAFASHCDHRSYHGWVFAYDTTNLSAAPHVLITSPSSQKGGIWQSGVGLTADANGIYTGVGNGAKTGQLAPPADYSESALRLDPTTLAVTDFFTPANYLALNSKDNDLDTGMVLVAAHDLFITGTKAGTMYLLNRTSLGGFHSPDKIIQTVSPGGVLHDGPIYFDVPGGHESVYVWPANRKLTAYAMAANGTLSSPRTAPVTVAQHPGGALAVSTNGTAAGSSILWASAPEGVTTGPGVLYAFNPNTLAILWSSTENSARDAVGTFAKFTRPVVANGRVYMATHDGLFRVYGLLGSEAGDAGADADASSGGCVSSTGGVWANTAFPAHTGTFTVEYDVTPSISPSNAVVGLSNGAQTTYAAFSTDTRLNLTGTIDAFNGAAATYQAATAVPYSAGLTYHFRLVIDTTTQTYSVFVTPPGGTELAIGSNFGFRAPASSLDSWGVDTHAGNGSSTVCKFAIP
jgi:hypothetical protein